jgi:hypothetical protein
VSTLQQGTRRVTEAISFSRPHPKRVALLEVENRTFFNDAAVAETFRTPFLEALGGFCSDLSLTVPAEDGSPAGLANPPRQPSGRIDNLELAEIGRRYGVHAGILLRDISVTAEERPRGVLMFRNIVYDLSVRARLEIYSMATGAKLADELLVRRETVDWEEYDAVRTRDGRRVYELPGMMTALSRQAAERACDAIRKEPWRAFVMDVDGNRGVLSSGREAGLAPRGNPDAVRAGRDHRRTGRPAVPDSGHPRRPRPGGRSLHRPRGDRTGRRRGDFGREHRGHGLRRGESGDGGEPPDRFLDESPGSIRFPISERVPIRRFERPVRFGNHSDIIRTTASCRWRSRHESTPPAKSPG